MMRIGYPCMNYSVGCTSASTFRLASYTDARLEAAVASNLACLRRILEFNREKGILFFRVSSDLVPLASHPVCKFDWRKRFAPELEELGAFIKAHGMRAAAHPDQFVVLSSPDPRIVANGAGELAWQADLLDLMKLGPDAKLQIHAGGVYGDKPAAARRFAAAYRKLPAKIRRRLCVENDDRLYSAADCLAISGETGIPVIFDYFHHLCLNGGEKPAAALRACAATWKKKDGPPIVDYSSQKKGGRFAAHADTLDPADFRKFLAETAGIEFDLMLEIKDKEKSALKALALAARGLPRKRG